ncbi:uncharacterized protein LOC128132252 [Lactuca sativa]|uniref:Probable quinone oxidoreductase n=1 Tax=Lactuca sativa TaxID=4236 RepID=A0A9R1XRZ4_LACSA|nr:uncharacterized protein LOC111889937 [Lactuca sativa]XP_052624686.1 uncharacterized protein LOC128132252 [Lactuca sativa]KAJ0222114.1 hypothetical protein LSAT_V11C200097730 [Lactuca sativa]KAJ0223284.1 hypothetical protein LSAT_V11C200097710 [Lactuca sativa]
MVKAIRIHEHGGPEVLKWEDVQVPDPKEGEIRLKQKAVGLNFLDVYMRRGEQNLAPPLPYIPGMEGAGVVTAVGPGVTSCKVGDVVAYASPEVGSYAQERILPADLAVPVPSSVDPVDAAAAIFKGLTAHVLIHKGFKVESGHTILVHAAAGGVGSLVCQWANAIGATVIGTVSTKEKAAQAKEDGCHHVICYKEENFVDRVMEITSGKGLEVVYDSVGKDTFIGSLECLKNRGYMVLFGTASGVPEPLRVEQIAPKSLYYTFSSITEYTVENRKELLVAAQDLFSNIAKGVLRIHLNHKYPLSQAIQAHTDLESRKTSGSVVLIPDEE